MNITIDYKLEDYVADLAKTAEIKIEILYKKTPLGNIMIAFIVLFFLATGIKTEETGHYLVGTIVVIIGVVILVPYIAASMIMNSKRKNLRSFAKQDKVDVGSFKIFTLTETMFAIRTKETYSENSWNDYANYLDIDEFIFVITKGNVDQGLHYAMFINKKQLYKEQYEELIAFLASKLPVWRR